MRQRLDGLDGLRGIAALLVLCYHALTIFRPDAPRFAGYLAVDFFFMLSGYVMARTYEARLATGWPVHAFFWVRLRRLWPTCMVGMLLGIPMLAHTAPAGWETSLLLNLLLLPAMAFHLFPVNSPIWSVSAELLGNGVHGLLLHRLSLRWVAVLAAGLLWALVEAAAHWGSLDIGWSKDNLPGLLPRVLFPYLIGLLMFRAWHDIPPLPMPGWIAPMLLGCLMLLPPSVLGDLAFVLLLCPLLILAGLQWSPPRAAIALGAASFPLYAVHYPLLDLARFDASFLLLIPAFVILLTAVSKPHTTIRVA